MGSETYLQDSLLEDFADGVVTFLGRGAGRRSRVDLVGNGGPSPFSIRGAAR